MNTPDSPTYCSPGTDRAGLRREMRRRRRLLPQTERTRAAQRLAKVIHRARLLRPGMRIAVYLSHDGEMDLSAVVAIARRHRCRLYLPRITQRRTSQMQFVPFDSHTRMRRNAFGIPEPESGDRTPVPVRELDLVFLPLVAFDARGARLGSGAGYYDRRLSGLTAARRWRRPRLIGVGYEFQRIGSLATEPWDVPLHLIATEQRLYRVRQSPND